MKLKEKIDFYNKPEYRKLFSQSKDDWDKMGYNDSSVHTDIISTTDRTVMATLSEGDALKIPFLNPK